ncbi:hypothetical protein FUA23_13660 [Neolewinella aurantiaca]|uniref:Uncharacterized protein n=1 Tax=Neolewinella aurantiaca TaxID=2602767 RepID=A0A5C7FTF5_9BACT|nr:hypothetical protein [Neolewinella aurantiaca]TXF88708.1 hypothetical protein FUA23_13660 [Neolewinella aurantiaca]
MTSRHYSQLYRQLRDLDPHDYQKVIRRYEEKETELGRLDTLEYFELTVFYTDALYQTGAFRQHQLMVDLVIETSIRDSFVEVEDFCEDIYQFMLFRKAAAAYRLRDFETAIHIGRELIRIDSGRRLYVRFLRTALFKEQINILQFGRAAFIFFTLFAALLITINLLFVANFSPAHVSVFRWVIGGVFTLGLALLAGSYGFAAWRAHRQAFGFQQNQVNK